MEGEWHDVFVTSYDEDGSAWFKGLENGNSGTPNLFFEDLEFRELALCQKDGCCPDYQSVVGACRKCKKKLKSSYKKEEWIQPVAPSC